MKYFKVFFLMLMALTLSNCVMANEFIILDDQVLKQSCDCASQPAYQAYGYDGNIYGNPGGYNGGYYSPPFQQPYSPQYNWGQLDSYGWLQVLAFMALAFIGKVFHFWVDVKKSVLREGGLSGLYRYFFVDHVGATVKAIVSTVIAAAGFFSINAIPVAWPMLTISAFLVGYTSDSLFNRGITHYS